MKERGTFVFKLENFNIDKDEEGEEKELVLRVEDLLGMILKYANKLVEK